MDYTNSAMREAIDECIHDEMYRAILKMKLIDGWTYERIAEGVDRTPRQVGSVVQRYRPALFDYILKTS